MIAFVEGVLVSALPPRVVVNVHGVGYEAWVPLSTFERLPTVGKTLRLLTHMHVREDEQTLYGFATEEERDMFRLLVQHVNGVGPKLALKFLDGSTPSQFRSAVVSGDIAFLSTIKGVGKKMAEKVIVELRDKLGVKEAWQAVGSGLPAASPEAQLQQDALLALLALGYKQIDASKAINAVAPRTSIEDYVKEALRKL